MLRKRLVELLVVFLVASAAARADSFSNLPTLSQVVTALGFTPLSPANNLSEVAPATARTNLGLGTAATQNTGTAGTTIPLLNGANTWSGAQAYSGQVKATQGGGGSASAIVASGASNSTAIAWQAQGAGTDSGNYDSIVIGSSLIFRAVNDANSVGNNIFFVNRSGATPTLFGLTTALNLPKLASAPAPPGGGTSNLYVVQGTSGAGFCTLYVQGTGSTALASNYAC